jgi:hypothetical protein
MRNHPSRHRKERDDAALLTQEGDSHAFTVSIILCAELLWTAVPGQEGPSLCLYSPATYYSVGCLPIN